MQYATKGGHLLRLLGDEHVGDLSIDMVQGYINVRLDEGAHRETVRKELVVLRRALMAAKQRGLLVGDPRACIPEFRVRYVPRLGTAPRAALAFASAVGLGGGLHRGTGERGGGLAMGAAH